MIISKVLIPLACVFFIPLAAAAQTATDPTTPKAGCCVSADPQASAAQPADPAKGMACCQTTATAPAAPVIDHSAHNMPGGVPAQAPATEAKGAGPAAGCCGHKMESGKGHEGMACCAAMGAMDAKKSGMAGADKAAAGCCGPQAPKP